MLPSTKDEIYYTFTYVSSLIRFSPPLISETVLGSSGKCKWLHECDVWVNAHRSSRYSNTLLVSLNNRIYFREHPRAGIHMESDESGRSHRSTAITSLHFAQVGQPTQSNTLGDSDSFGLETLSHTNDTKRKKGDDLA